MNARSSESGSRPTLYFKAAAGCSFALVALVGGTAPHFLGSSEPFLVAAAVIGAVIGLAIASGWPAPRKRSRSGGRS